MITLYELRELFLSSDQSVRIWDCNSDENIYEGDFCDMPDELEDCEVSSIDNIYKRDFDGYITLNVIMD